jgi:hypothetical protein
VKTVNRVLLKAAEITAVCLLVSAFFVGVEGVSLWLSREHP